MTQKPTVVFLTPTLSVGCLNTLSQCYKKQFMRPRPQGGPHSQDMTEAWRTLDKSLEWCCPVIIGCEPHVSF